MKLTKDNIETIDNHLKAKGISYWDIRLEMTDHIACKMESKIGNYEFDSLFKHIIYDLGWDGDLKRFETRRLKSINKTIRKKYFNTILSFLINGKNLVLVLAAIFLYYLLFQNLSSTTFNRLSLLLFAVPILYFTAHYAYTTIKIKKSGYLLYGYFYVIFSMLMCNLFYQIPKPDGVIVVSLATRQYIVFFTTIVNVLCICSGIKVYIELYKQYHNVHKRLTSN